MGAAEGMDRRRMSHGNSNSRNLNTSTLPSPPPISNYSAGGRPATWRRQSVDRQKRESEGYPVLKVIRPSLFHLV